MLCEQGFDGGVSLCDKFDAMCVKMAFLRCEEVALKGAVPQWLVDVVLEVTGCVIQEVPEDGGARRCLKEGIRGYLLEDVSQMSVTLPLWGRVGVGFEACCEGELGGGGGEAYREEAYFYWKFALVVEVVETEALWGDVGCISVIL